MKWPEKKWEDEINELWEASRKPKKQELPTVSGSFSYNSDSFSVSPSPSDKENKSDPNICSICKRNTLGLSYHIVGKLKICFICEKSLNEELSELEEELGNGTKE